MSPSEAQRRWPDISGQLVQDAAGRRHVLPVRVYFEDTDFSGLVYHGSYVRWCERGRSDFCARLATIIARCWLAAAAVNPRPLWCGAWRSNFEARAHR